MTKKLFVALVINRLNKGIPVMVSFMKHTVLFVGYRYSGNSKTIEDIVNNVIFIYNDPKDDGGSNQEKPLNFFLENDDFNKDYSDYIIHYVTQPPSSKIAKTLKTIHLPYDENNSGEKECVRFVKTGLNPTKIAWTSWDTWKYPSEYRSVLKPVNVAPDTYYYDLSLWNGSNFLRELCQDAYKWINVSDSKISYFDDIELKNIPIYGYNNPKVAVHFYKSSQAIKTIIRESNSVSSNKYSFSNFEVQENPTTKISIGEKFRREITNSTEIIMRVALVADNALNDIDLTNSNNYYDKFDLKFTYVPSNGKTEFLIPDKPIMDMNDSNRLYLKYGVDENSAVDVSSFAEWSASSGSIVVDGTTYTYVPPTTPGIYTVTAKLAKGTLLSDNTTVEEDIIVSYKITVKGVFIVPLTHSMFSDETRQFNLFYGIEEDSLEVTASAVWRVIMPIIPAAPKMSPGMPDRAFGLPDPSMALGLFAPVGNHGTFEIEAVYNGLAAIAKVTVNPRELKIEPSPASVSVNMQRHFSAFADGTLLNEDVAWSSLFGGSIDQTGIYTASGEPGTYTISAKYLNLETSAVVLVKTLYLTPASLEIKVKETLEFSLKYGISGQSATEEVSSMAQWSVLPNVGNITNGLYTPAGAGTFEVTAEYAGVKVTAEIKVLQSE